MRRDATATTARKNKGGARPICQSHHRRVRNRSGGTAATDCPQPKTTIVRVDPDGRNTGSRHGYAGQQYGGVTSARHSLLYCSVRGECARRERCLEPMGHRELSLEWRLLTAGSIATSEPQIPRSVAALLSSMQDVVRFWVSMFFGNEI